MPWKFMLMIGGAAVALFGLLMPSDDDKASKAGKTLAESRPTKSKPAEKQVEKPAEKSADQPAE